MPTVEAEPQSSLSSNAYQALAPADRYEPLVLTEARLPEGDCSGGNLGLSIRSGAGT